MDGVTFHDLPELCQDAAASGGATCLSHQIVSSPDEGFVVLDAELRCRYWNPFMEKVTGQPAAAVLGRPILDIHPFPSVPDLEARLRQALAGASDRTVEVRHLAERDGWEGWTFGRLMPLRSPAGQVVGVVGFWHDITAHKRQTEALRLSEARYRRLVAATTDVVWTTDLELRFTSISPSVEARTGRPPAWYLGRSVLDLLTPESAARVREAASRELTAASLPQKDETWCHAVEVEEVRPDGEHIWVEVRMALEFDAAGCPKGLMGVVRDVSERRRVVNELEKSLSLLAATLESTTDGILVVDVAGRIVNFNRQFVEMWRLPEQVLAARDERRAMEHVLDQLKDPEGFREKVQRLYGCPDAESHDVLEFKDGRVFERTCRPQRVAGQVVGRLWSFRDVTERRRAEAALRVQSAALESAANAIVITDRTGQVVWSNPAFTRLTGYEFEEVRGRNLRFLKSGHHPPAFYAQLWKTITAGEVWHGEVVNRRKDGSLCTEEMTITPVRDGRGEMTHFIGIKLDISARKHMEEELRQSREHFRRIFQSSPTPVAITRLEDGRYLDVNESLVRMMGYSREELLGRTALELGVWVEPADRAELIRRITRQGSVHNFETRFRDKSGLIHDVLVSAELVQLGLVPCLIFISHDITGRKSLEEQLRQAQKMESIGTLAGGVAHDFNNLLTIIQGHTSLLLEQPALPADARQSLQQVARAARQAAHLTRQLLTFGRKQPVRLQPLDLNEVVANLARMLGRLIGEKILLELNYASQPLPVLADVGMMEQLLLNLVVNARDAMPEGGRLTLTTRRVPAAGLRRREAAGRDHVCLSVRDTGCGIPPESLPRIFEPFFTTKDFGKGTGLGLATVHGIVQQHQGWVEVESTPGTGTTFNVFLPAEAGAVPAPPSAASTTPPGGA